MRRSADGAVEALRIVVMLVTALLLIGVTVADAANVLIAGAA